MSYLIISIPGTLIFGQEEAIKSDKDVETPGWFDEYKEEIEDKISETIKGKCKQLYIYIKHTLTKVAFTLHVAVFSGLAGIILEVHVLCCIFYLLPTSISLLNKISFI